MELDMTGVDGGPTQKQMDLIEDITDVTGHVFYGITRHSASEFIDRYMEQYQELKDQTQKRENYWNGWEYDSISTAFNDWRYD